jgi:hypothetical protein
MGLSIGGREIGGGNPEVDKLLTGAFLAYSEGQPVVVLDKDEAVLHGVETLKSIVDLEMPLDAAVVRGVPRDYFESSEWPEVLEKARQLFMNDQFPQSPR